MSLPDPDSLLTEGGEQIPLTTVNDAPPNNKSWFGRCIRQITCSDVVKKITATFAAVGSVVFTCLGVQQFMHHGYSLTASMATGAGIGFCVPIAIGLGLSTPQAKKVLDFMAKWSFSGMQLTTNFALNAGFPISGIGLWNASVPTAAVVYGSNMVFAAIATCYLSLHLRAILLKRSEPEPDPEAAAEKNRLLIECGTDQPKRFAVEQLVKLGIAGSLLTLEQLAVISAPEWKYLSLFLFGSIAGSTGAFSFYKLKDHIEKKYPTRITTFDINVPWPTQLVRTIEKVGFFAAAPIMGILFPIKSAYTLIGFGAFYATQKITLLRRFENLQESPQKLSDIKWKTPQTVAQGILVALGATWFIYGMTDPLNTIWDRIYLSSMLASALISYPATRALIQKWQPAQQSKILNTLRFYIVDNPSLYIPYFVRRFSGTLGGSVQPNSTLQAIEDTIAWSSFGSTWGSHTAFNGASKTTPDSSPMDLSPITVIASSTILASKGTLGGV